MTPSTRCAALFAMRRAPHEEQNPRRLLRKRDQLLMRAVRTAHAQKAMCQYAAFEKGLELVLDKLRQARTGLCFHLGDEGLQLFLHHLIERRFFRAPPLVGKGGLVASGR